MHNFIEIAGMYYGYYGYVITCTGRQAEDHVHLP